jgi:hypothetical protein
VGLGEVPLQVGEGGNVGRLRNLGASGVEG